MTPSDLGFKFQSYRRGQLDSAIDIASTNQRFTVLDAPPGAGKTLIYMTASTLLDSRTLVLTGTKGLQAQLTDDYGGGHGGLVDVRGHGNYPCGVRGSSSLSPSPRNLVPGEESSGARWEDVCKVNQDSCHYLGAIAESIQSRLSTTNYAMWLTSERFGKSDLLGKFDLIVLDEAHSAIDWLSKYVSFVLNSDEVQSLTGLTLPSHDDNDRWMSWLRLFKSKVDKTLDSPPIGGVDIKRLRGLSVNLGRIVDHDIEWIFDDTKRGIRLTPVWAHPFAESYLYRGSAKVILSSATITPDTARYLGIDDDDLHYHEVSSSFDPANRPFYYIPTVRVDHRMGEGEIRILVNRIDNVIRDRVNCGRKGLIQTRSYRWMREISRRSKFKDLMLTHESHNLRKVLAEHRSSSRPTILLSPSVGEGFDFIDDDARYQIIIKIPFVDSRDPITKARSKSDKGYLNYLAALGLVQQYGRTTRTHDDWSETFIFDNHWAWFRKKASFSKWFKSAWHQTTTIPPPLDINRR